MNYIFSKLITVLACKFCEKGDLSFHEMSESRKGLCSRLRQHCTTRRQATLIFDSSGKVTGSDRGKICDVNRRARTGAVLMGTSHQAIVRFCAAFDLPPFSLRDSWDAHVGHKGVNIIILSTYRHTYVPVV